MTVFGDVEARALIAGESVVAFVARNALTEGDEVVVTAGHVSDPGSVKPAYRRWSGVALPEGEWVAVVEAVHPATLLDPGSGASRHVLIAPDADDLVILRVFAGSHPVLSDEVFAARVRSIEGALSG